MESPFGVFNRLAVEGVLSEARLPEAVRACGYLADGIKTGDVSFVEFLEILQWAEPEPLEEPDMVELALLDISRRNHGEITVATLLRELAGVLEQEQIDLLLYWMLPPATEPHNDETEINYEAFLALTRRRRELGRQIVGTEGAERVKLELEMYARPGARPGVLLLADFRRALAEAQPPIPPELLAEAEQWCAPFVRQGVLNYEGFVDWMEK